MPQIFGAGDPKATGQYVRDLIKRRVPARVFEDSAFTFVHVDDVAEAIVQVLEKEGNLTRSTLSASTPTPTGNSSAW
jgi:nucleoside-diphosphate-sugar epimerase